MVNLGSLRGMGQLKDKVYELECVVPKAHERVSVASEGDKCIDLWRQHLGHVDEQTLRDTVPQA